MIIRLTKENNKVESEKFLNFTKITENRMSYAEQKWLNVIINLLDSSEQEVASN